MPTGPMKPSGPSEAHLLRARLAHAPSERVLELDLVDAVIAAHEHEHDAALAIGGHDGIGLEQPALGHAERVGDLRDARSPGVSTRSGAGSSGGSATGCASACATSTFAA